MGFLQDLRDRLKGRERQTNDAIEKVGDIVDEKTGKKYHDKIESAKDKVANTLGVAQKDETSPTEQAKDTARDKAENATPTGQETSSGTAAGQSTVPPAATTPPAAATSEDEPAKSSESDAAQSGQADTGAGQTERTTADEQSPPSGKPKG